MSATNRAIAVLGMHRSGTSALTGSLEQAGVYIGETSDPSADNVKGNRESVSILTLHDDLLQRNGGAWDRPVRNMRWDPVHRALQTSIIQNFNSYDIWGFKDPRTLLTTNMWLKAIPSLEFVGIFRHPFLVADSLIKRDNKTTEDALDLWFIYNTNLLWLANNHERFPILEFSTGSAEFQRQLDKLVAILDLDKAGINFFSDKLRHSDIPELRPSPIANRCLQLYETLQQFRIDYSEAAKKTG